MLAHIIVFLLILVIIDIIQLFKVLKLDMQIKLLFLIEVNLVLLFVNTDSIVSFSSSGKYFSIDYHL